MQGELAEHLKAGEGIWLTAPRGISARALMVSQNALLSMIVRGKSNYFLLGWMPIGRKTIFILKECGYGGRPAYATACGSKVESRAGIVLPRIQNRVGRWLAELGMMSGTIFRLL